MLCFASWFLFQCEPVIQKHSDCLSISEHQQLMGMLTATPDESEESWTIQDEIDEEGFYNMEFNVEPKMQSVSSKQSSRLTKQLSYVDYNSSVQYE